MKGDQSCRRKKIRGFQKLWTGKGRILAVESYEDEEDVGEGEGLRMPLEEGRQLGSDGEMRRASEGVSANRRKDDTGQRGNGSKS